MKIASLFILFAPLTESARVQVHDQNDVGWGRTCESLKSRFTQQGSRLRELEGTRALMGSISLMRTLRRANARECTWIQDGNVDVTAISELAGSYLQQSPCYEQSQSALQASQHLPEEERENAVMAGLAILFSNHEDCSPDDGDASPELGDTSDETLEQEMDDTTDNIVEVMVVSHEESSLIQREKEKFNPLSALAAAPLVAAHGWQMAFGFNAPVLIGVILFTIILALFCGAVMNALVRIFRWIWCRLSRNSCEDSAPATWLTNFVHGGCAIASLTYGPITGLIFMSAIAR